jgi:hypothetical protein
MGREERRLRKEERQNKVVWRRSGKMVRHHITNRCNGGTSTQSNLLLFDRNREKAWHFLFKNLSFEEVAELLLRTCRAKGRT